MLTFKICLFLCSIIIFTWFPLFAEPVGAVISVTHESVLFDQVQKTEVEKRLLAQLRNRSYSERSSEKAVKRGCFYTTIPKSVKQRNINGEELTALNLDKVIAKVSGIYKCSL